MNYRLFIYASLIVAFFVMVLAPSVDLASTLAQIPPPELPGAPDQSPLWGAGLAAAIAILFGIRRLAKRNS